MQNEGFSTFGVQNRNLRITVGIIMEKDPKCAKTLILHTTPVVNYGEKQNIQLQNFVPGGHPRHPITLQI